MLAIGMVASTVFAQTQPTAVADVRDRQSRFIGTVSLAEESGGVHLLGILRNLPPGPHGIHVTNVAKCLSPSFASAGAIFNPAGKRHGLRNPAGPEVGDLETLVVPPSGIANLDVMVQGATLSSGATSLIGGSGTALVIHAADDDQVTDPEGNSGDRIACGLILPRDPVAASATAQSRSVQAPTLAPQSAAAAPTLASQGPALAPTLAAPSAAAPASSATQPAPTIGVPLIVAVVGVALIAVGWVLRRWAHT